MRDVGDEVAPHAIQLLGLRDVAHHDDGALLHAEVRAGERQRAANRLHAFQVEAAPGVMGAIAEHLLDEVDQPGFAGEIEHVARRSARRDAEDLAEGGVQEPDSAAGVGHQHALGHAGDGGAQVIALGLDRADLLAGVARDPLQGSAEAGELALLGDAKGDRVVAATHQVGGTEELAERPEEGAREPPRDQGDQRQRGKPGEKQDPGEMAIQGRDRGERPTETQDPRAAPAVVDQTGGVEGVLAGGVAVADGAAVAAGEGLGDLRPVEVVVHRRELVVLAVAVGEHDAVDGDHRDAEIGPLDELPQAAFERQVGRGEQGRCRHRRDEQSGVLGELGGRALGECARQQDRRQDRRQGERGESRPEGCEAESGGERVGHGREDGQCTTAANRPSAGFSGVLRKGGGKGCGKVTWNGQGSVPFRRSSAFCTVSCAASVMHENKRLAVARWIPGNGLQGCAGTISAAPRGTDFRDGC